MSDEYTSFKLVFHVRVKNPHAPYPAGGDYMHKTVIQGITHSLKYTSLPYDAVVTLDKVIEVTGRKEK